MPEDYSAIARTVASIMQVDYAGQPECASCTSTETLLAEIATLEAAGTLNDTQFVQLIRLYLAAFQDPGLVLEVSNKADFQPTTCGFAVRRYNNELYVTQVREDTRLTPGDVILFLDGKTPDEYLVPLLNNPVNGTNPERQLWDEELTQCTTLQVRHTNGTEETIATHHFPRPSLKASLQPPTVTLHENAGSNKDERAVVIAAHHFADASVLEAMQAHFEDIQHANRVIIDIRDAQEGMIGNAFGLMALFFTEEINLKDFMGPELVYTRYTERNARLRVRQLMHLLQISDAAGKSWVQAEIDHVVAWAGQGVAKEAEFEEDMLFPPAPAHQKTFLLTDVHTGGPAERLVVFAKRAAPYGVGKVRTVGRATKGSLDYSTLVVAPLSEKFSLVYPIAKTEDAYQGRGLRTTGLMPDIYIPFTPEECKHDVILERALIEV